MSEATIIVGAGSAGSVIAARMTERADRQVLLLEAGPDYPPGEAELPANLRDGRRNSMHAHDWGFRHRPRQGQVLFPFPRGRVVGGSSAVNTCIALRGQPFDYDDWAARGLPEWSWEHCLPAFKRLETDLDKDDAWHGRAGPIPIRRHPVSELVPWQAAFLEACERLGLPACSDHNGPAPEGYGPHPMNKVEGERMSAARCYLTAAVRRRDNLRIRANTLVRRVLTEGRRVTGLEVETAGRVEVIRGARVVLCGGAIATPGILLRSGIGPRAKVERLGVPLVMDLPAVAARLLDHYGSAVMGVPKRWGIAGVRDPILQTMLRFTSQGSPFPNDMQLQPGSCVALPGIALPIVSMLSCVGKTRGHGSLEYRSADPHERPWIRSEVLTHPADIDAAAQSMELGFACMQQKPMRDLAYLLWPSAAVLRDRQKVREWVVKSCDSSYHPCGTVPMGADDDAGAAVDGRGRVRGVEGLVVADASIMPSIPSVNINVPTLMIGERFGEWLRDGQ